MFPEGGNRDVTSVMTEELGSQFVSHHRRDVESDRLKGNSFSQIEHRNKHIINNIKIVVLSRNNKCSLYIQSENRDKFFKQDADL